MEAIFVLVNVLKQRGIQSVKVLGIPKRNCKRGSSQQKSTPPLSNLKPRRRTSSSKQRDACKPGENDSLRMVNDALRQNGEVHEYNFVGVGYICSRSYYGKDGVHLNSTDALQRSCGNWTFDGAARGVVARDTGLSCCFPNAPPRATYNKRHMQSSLRLIYLITIETNPGPKPVVCPICMRSINDRKEIRRPLNTGIFSALSKKSPGAEIRNHYLIHGQMRPTNWAVVPQIVTNRKRLMKIWQNLQKNATRIIIFLPYTMKCGCGKQQAFGESTGVGYTGTARNWKLQKSDMLTFCGLFQLLFDASHMCEPIRTWP